MSDGFAQGFRMFALWLGLTKTVYREGQAGVQRMTLTTGIPTEEEEEEVQRPTFGAP